MNILERVISVREAAELWGLSPGTVKNMCAAGTVKAKKIGPTWVIDSAQETPARRPSRVKKRKEDEPDPNQITLFDVPEEPETAPEPAPAPPDPPRQEIEIAPLDADDLEYFADMYQQYIEWEEMQEQDADERLRAVLAAYEYAPHDADRILEKIKGG